MYVIALLLLSTLTGKTDIFTEIESVITTKNMKGLKEGKHLTGTQDESLNLIVLVIIIHELQCA